MGFALVLAVVTVAVLVAITHVEHPLEDAAAEGQLANDVKANQEAKQPGTSAPRSTNGGGRRQLGPDRCCRARPSPCRSRRPSSRSRSRAATPEGRRYDFQVDNDGKIQHDLAVEDGGQEKKTPLIKAGSKADLKVALKPGKYRFYCTVPGHAQSGMQQEVTVK